MTGPIGNGKNTPINVQTGSVPNLSGAMRDWYQPMVFEIVTKVVSGFQVQETGEEVAFRGVIQPLSGRRLEMKPEGQRAWTWILLHSDPSLTLQVDSVVKYLGVQTRIMSRKNYKLYGFIEYELVQDWTGSGPTVTP